jgi:hypothetical protein
MLDSPHTLVPMLMRGNTLPQRVLHPTHHVRAGSPPNRQPATVSEEERGGRGPSSRRTSMRAAPNCSPPPTAWHASTPRTSTRHPPNNKMQSTGSCAPCTGKGDSAGAGPQRRATRQAAGRARAAPPPPTAPPTQPHTTRPPPTTTGLRKGGHPVVSNLPLHRAMQQRCHHASASARSLSWHAPSPPAAGSHCQAREGSVSH